MESRRKLRLEREALVDLTEGDLARVGGGATAFSCLDYISCNPLACVLSRAVCLDPEQ